MALMGIESKPDDPCAYAAYLYRRYLAEGKGNKSLCYYCGGTVRNWYSI